MTSQQLSPAKTRTHDILAATNLLHRMMSELHRLRTATSPFLATAIDAHELREQSHELFETVRMLTREPDRQPEELRYKALGLIKRLARELEYLACEAERDSHKVSHGLECPGMEN